VAGPVLRARRHAVSAARGDRPFDVLIVNGDVLDVGTCTLRRADVGIVGDVIASVHPAGSRADAHRTIDARGEVVCPGFIDMHVHFESSMLTASAYAAAVVPRGTTTVHCDPHELANVAGLAGVRYAIDSSRNLPLEFLVQAPSCVPPVPGRELSAADFGPEEIAEMLSWPEIAGLAEVMDMQGVIAQDERMAGVVQAAVASGKLVNGHAAGLKGKELQAYLAAGIGSDHELMVDGDFLERVQSGMTVELRGVYEFLIPDVVTAMHGFPHLPVHVVAATDDLFASTLLQKGGVDHLLRRLVAAGLDPVVAIRMATYNAAYRLGRFDLGLVAAGRAANVLVLSDLASLAVHRVLFRGAEVARDGRLLAELPETAGQPPTETVRLAEMSTDDFTFKVDAPAGSTAMRVLRGVVYTEWETRTVQCPQGRPELPPDCIYQAVIHRHGRRPATPSVGVLSGWGSWRGAVATTVSHDTHNLVVFGRDPADMAAAANSVIAAGGGVAVAAGGQVLASVALPIAGLLSSATAGEVAAAQDRVERAALDVGLQPSVLSQPLFQVMTATLPCLPGPHVTDLGIADGTTGELIGSLPVAD
jgi:adenine deaminase